jgi:hypothetical protein
VVREWKTNLWREFSIVLDSGGIHFFQRRKSGGGQIYLRLP